MAVLWITVYTVMVTVVTSKPLCLNVGEDSSKSLESSESSESSSLEETATGLSLPANSGPSPPAVTDMPNTVEPDPLNTAEPDPLNTAEPDPLNTALLPSADAGPSPATLNTSALPHQEDPQTSTDIDALQFMPDGPSQTPLGVDISKDMPDAARDFLDVDAVHVVPDTQGSLHPGPLETDIGVKKGNATSTPPPAPKSFSKTTPLKIPTGTTNAPVCSTVQFTTPEPPPRRGDNK